LTLHRLLKVTGEETLVIDVLLAGREDHLQILDNAVLSASEAGTVPVASRDDIIKMKLLRNSPQDQVDIEGLRNDSDRESGSDCQ